MGRQKATRSEEDPPRIKYVGHSHPSHESMILNPPEGFRMSFSKKRGGYGNYTRPPSYKPVRRVAVNAYSRVFRMVGCPRMLPVLGSSDLLHVDGCVIPVTKMPWIVGSIEHASNFFSFDGDWQEVISMRRMLTKGLQNERCRKILCLSEAAAESLRFGLKEDYQSIGDKVDVLYPAVPSKCLARAKRHGKHDESTRVLFVGNHFFDKGGREVLSAFNRIRERHDARLDMVTDVPPKHREPFERIKNQYIEDERVKFYTRIPRDVLWDDFYAKADVFCFPSYMETFGYVVLEAMANRLAVVATNQFAIPEIVKHEETGLLVKPPIAAFERGVARTTETVARYRDSVMHEELFGGMVDSLEAAIEKLIKDDSLRQRLARKGYESVEQGDFSVTHRNQELTRIYREALGSD